MADYKKELEEFSYIVSHDLNAPLRHIREFSKLLMDSLEGKISEEEKLYFRYVRDGTIQVESMIASLLDYSRLNTQSSDFKEFNLSKLTCEVLESLHGEYTIKSDGLPEIFKGDEGQIFILIDNLLRNAIKFKKTGAKANINFSAEQNGSEWTFSISDDGFGIPVNQMNNVFKIFKTINPNDGVAGTGVGLALCKKIVDRHGGNIWIDPDYADGTKVCFTLADDL